MQHSLIVCVQKEKFLREDPSRQSDNSGASEFNKSPERTV